MEIIKELASYVAYIIEGAAILVIFVGSVQAIILYLKRILSKKNRSPALIAE